MARPAVALGLVPHTGWAHAVAVTGDARAPQVLHRERVELVQEGIERFAYHLVQEWPVEKAARSVAEAQEAARRTSAEVVAALAGTARKAGRLVGIGIVGQPHDVPDELERILAKHHLLHAAEGELYLSALLEGADAARTPVTLLPPKGTVEHAASLLGTPAEVLTGRLTALRKELGSPWQADHRAATAAALVVLDS